MGERLGTLLGRLGHMVQPRPGLFADQSLRIVEPPLAWRDLPAWLDEHAEKLDRDTAEGLRPVVETAQDLLDEDRRACLVHADLNPKNLLVDPETLEITGVLDWEFAHSGIPWTDLGNLLRLDRDPVFAEAVLAGYRAFMPAVPDDVLDRARAADLFALVELAARRERPRARRTLTGAAGRRGPHRRPARGRPVNAGWTLTGAGR